MIEVFGPVKQRLSGETSALFSACDGLLLSGIWHSVPERAFSGTEYARGAQKGFLRYATHFRKHSV